MITSDIPIATTKWRAPAKIVSIPTRGSPSVALRVKTEMPKGGHDACDQEVRACHAPVVDGRDDLQEDDADH